MSEELTNSHPVALSRTGILVVSGVIGVLLAATVALWAHYGTAIFFEAIRSGFMACFG
jgi:hypothetical protein